MEGRPMPYVGAHVGKPHNFDSIGVSLFGNFMEHMPLEVQMQKLIPLLADLCVEYGISPDNILGHRDMDSNYGATSCPGNAFYFGTNQLASVRSEVKKLIGSNPGNGTPYPDAGGVVETENPVYSEPMNGFSH